MNDTKYKTLPLQKGTYSVKREDLEQFLKDADAGGVVSTRGKKASDHFANCTFGERNVFLIYYGNAINRLGWSTTEYGIHDFIYKPTPQDKPKPFTKDMLIAGKHVVEDYYGNKYLVLFGGIVTQFLPPFNWDELQSYSKDLTHITGSYVGCDIHRVYEIAISGAGFNLSSDKCLKLVWSREDQEKG